MIYARELEAAINSNSYEVVISNPLDVLINEMGFSFGSTKHINAINAPMPGLILEINVEYHPAFHPIKTSADGNCVRTFIAESNPDFWCFWFTGLPAYKVD